MKKTCMFLLLLGTMAQPLLANELIYFWSGAITPTSARVNAVVQYSANVRLVVSTDNGFSSPLYSLPMPATSATSNAVALDISGLTPNTTYYYAIEMDGVMDTSPEDMGTFKTFQDGPFSYKFAAASCNFFPDNEVYDRMRIQTPLFYLMPGDLHYADPSSTNVQVHRDAYEDRVLSQTAEKAFLKNTPIAYVWDDHDFCGNNNDGSSGCGAAAKQAYTEYVPHYPLGAPAGSNSIYQAFTVGRVRFIMSDLRSERIGGDIMSPAQKTWFKNEVVAARDLGLLICWVSSVSYSGNETDNWGGYTATRTELGDFFRDSNIVNMFLVSGDAHMVAIDNGTHSDFSTGLTNPNQYPILQSAALNNVGSDKGGTYSEGGTFPNPLFASQWSTVEVTDNGGADICVAFTSYRWNTVLNTQSTLTSYQFCRTLPVNTAGIDANNGAGKLSVSPNPGDSVFNLSLDYSGTCQVKMLNYTGQVILKKQNETFDHTYKLDVSDVAAGVYYIIVETTKGNFTAKVVKQ